MTSESVLGALSVEVEDVISGLGQRTEFTKSDSETTDRDNFLGGSNAGLPLS
jgi:hypothetical protein